jgi:hypothetical protein
MPKQRSRKKTLSSPRLTKETLYGHNEEKRLLSTKGRVRLYIAENGYLEVKKDSTTTEGCDEGLRHGERENTYEMNPTASKLKGLVKLHKESRPTRPLMNCIRHRRFFSRLEKGNKCKNSVWTSTLGPYLMWESTQIS